MALASDLHEDLVQVPDIAQPTLAALDAPRLLGTELPTPPPDGLVGYEDYGLREERLDVTEAEAESVAQPHPMSLPIYCPEKPGALKSQSFSSAESGAAGLKLAMPILNLSLTDVAGAVEAGAGGVSSER